MPGQREWRRKARFTTESSAVTEIPAIRQ